MVSICPFVDMLSDVGMAASLNDILITQFKSIFTLSDFASAFVQSAFCRARFTAVIS